MLDCKQLRHISKVCKSRNKASKQAQLAEGVDAHGRNNILQSLASQQMTPQILG